jgi:hypothetical protein
VDHDTEPALYPQVLAAEGRVTAIEAARQDAERTLAEREVLLARAEAAAAERVADGLEAPSLVPERRAVQQAAETLHLLALAHGTAKTRHAEALAQAEVAHRQAVWRHFQALLATHLVAAQQMVETWEPLRAYCAAHGWAFGLQPFSGSVPILGESWVPHAEALLAQAEPGHSGALPPMLQPRAY